MYKYSHPIPIVVNLNTDEGFEIRQKAAKFVTNTLARGAESGSVKQQGFGAVAEIYIKDSLGFKKDSQSLGYDFILPSGLKVDVKCRGGELPFKEVYTTEDGSSREAKHNFFARQLYDGRLDADIYIMTHLKTPIKGEVPGTRRQTSWFLYICGWVSKKRVIRDGVFLPRGSLTERLRDWFSYKADEIEFFNKNLNGIEDLSDILTIEQVDLEKDIRKEADLNMTSVDALRLSYDLVGRGVLKESHIGKIKNKLGMIVADRTTFHPNQYFHLMKWLYKQGLVTKGEVQKLKHLMKEVDYQSSQVK